jgi:hypothetical protein
MAKVALGKKKALFTSKSDLDIMTKLVQCYTWSKAFYVLKLGRFGK